TDEPEHHDRQRYPNGNMHGCRKRIPETLIFDVAMNAFVKCNCTVTDKYIVCESSIFRVRKTAVTKNRWTCDRNDCPLAKKIFHRKISPIEDIVRRNFTQTECLIEIGRFERAGQYDQMPTIANKSA